MGNSVDVVIPIYKAGNDFVKMLEKLYKQSKRPGTHISFTDDRE